MTLFTATKSRSSRTSGFTLVEMLTVIGIIVLLIGILLPALNIAYKHSIQNRMNLDIQSIATALESYRNDMRTYPTLDYASSNMSAAYPGSVLLCNALIAQGSNDGAPGPGFTTVPNGQIYGPYLEPGRYKLVQDPGAGPTGSYYIGDRYSHPILYFKANITAIPSSANGYVAAWSPSPTVQAPRYNFSDDSGSTSYPALVWTTDGGTGLGLQRMQMMLGDFNANGQIDPQSASFGAETPVMLPFILWSAGPDEVFGIDVSKGTGTAALQVENSTVPACDDAMNKQ